MAPQSCSVKVTAPREAKPVQICDIDVENDCIVCNHDALEIVERNLQHAGVESIVIISIMGLYRTGKSFFLDLLMRYLNGLGKPGWLGKSEHEVDPDSWRFSETEMDHPGWLKCGAQGKSDRISEGRVDDTAFPWRAGAQRLTRGMWMWSAPYVVKTSKGLKGILLMDTQGAWDSEMTKDLSACVFALTAILSSKLVYNVRNSLNAQNVENLDYFTTVAKVILPDEDVGRMGELQVLIRDWEHYDEGATLEQCHEEVFKHRQDFLSKDHAKNSANVEAIDRLENIFSHITVTALPHPGLIFQKTWKGEIKDINKDFIFLLDRFFADLLAGIELCPPSAPMGEPLNGENFASIMASTIEAFQTTPTEAINLRDAFVTLRVLRSKNAIDGIIDTKVREFRMSRLQDPSAFNSKLYLFKEEMIEMFRTQIAPLKLEKEEALLQELSDRLKQMIDEAATNNTSKFFSATVKLIAGPVIVLPAAFAFLSLPHLILYLLIGTGGIIHLRFRSENWRLFNSSTGRRVFQDIETFGRQRLADGQSIGVVANRCFANPQAVTALTVAQATQMRQMQVIHEGL
eukprot:GEMP01006941.1.p1 GENE.GEMP01006941.1~~GEMP01006941.1.p1  ORF type:complete len:573 (+),score=77.27 GEMP01006941.1:230-1948(+)